VSLRRSITGAYGGVGRWSAGRGFGAQGCWAPTGLQHEQGTSLACPSHVELEQQHVTVRTTSFLVGVAQLAGSSDRTATDQVSQNRAPPCSNRARSRYGRRAPSSRRTRETVRRAPRFHWTKKVQAAQQCAARIKAVDPASRHRAPPGTGRPPAARGPPGRSRAGRTTTVSLAWCARA
jgi:hypothetical protein